MDKVYICSMYGTRGDRNTNLEFAKMFCMSAIEEGKVPICPHLFLHEVLDDNNVNQRAAGLAIGQELLKDCTELRICSPISEGMRAEILMALEIGVPVRIANMRCAYIGNKALEMERLIQREYVEVIRDGKEYFAEAYGSEK